MPSISPYFFERFHLKELIDFIEEGKKRNRVPCHMNVYYDIQDTLFSVIFCGVPDASQYEIEHGLSPANLTRRANELKETHRIHNFVCYKNVSNVCCDNVSSVCCCNVSYICSDACYNNDSTQCVAVFEPTREQNGTEKTELMIDVPYDEYQQRSLVLQDQDMQVFHRKIYFCCQNLSVSAIFRNSDYLVSLVENIEIWDLYQLIKRNERRGYFLADGNARMDGDQVIYSVVFTTQKFGNCDYRVEFNVDGLQLYYIEERYAREGCHISVIIPNTGSLTPQYIAVFWCTD